MKMNLKVSISKNGTVGERAVPNLDGKAGMTRVGIMISIAGVTRIGIVNQYSRHDQSRNQGYKDRDRPQPQERSQSYYEDREHNTHSRDNSTRGRSLATSRSENTQQNRSLMIAPMSD